MIYAAAGVVVALLGGSIGVTLPVDERVDVIEQRLAQNWQDRETWQQQQAITHNRNEVRDIEWRMNYISDEINRLNMLPQYLNRGLSSQELWQLERLKAEWEILQERLHEISD